MECLWDGLGRTFGAYDQVFVSQNWNGDPHKLAVTLIFSHNLVTLHDALLLRFGFVNARKLQIKEHSNVIHGSFRFGTDSSFRLLNTLLVRVLLCNQILRGPVKFLRKTRDEILVHDWSWKQILVCLRRGLGSRIDQVLVLDSIFYSCRLWLVWLWWNHWNEVFVLLGSGGVC